jgi:hypothetical protein
MLHAPGAPGTLQEIGLTGPHHLTECLGLSELDFPGVFL